MALTKATYSMVQGAPINVLDYGAVGDGVTDDTSAITNAVAACVAENKTLYVPTGVYIIKEIDSESFSIFAESNAVFKLKTGGAYIFNIDGTNSFTWQNIILDGNGETAYAYTIANVDGVVMNDVSVTGFADRCCVFEQSATNVQIVGGTYSDCTGADVLVLKSNYNTITGCHFRDIQEHAVRFGRFSSDAAVDSGCYSTVSGCTFDNVTNDPVLCELNSKFITVENNNFFEARNICKITPATDDCHSINVIGNTLRKPKGVVSGFTRGVSALDSDRVTVANNVIDLAGSEVGGVTTNADAGIVVGTNCTVSGNVITGASANNGISCEANTSVNGNVIKDFVVNGIGINGDSCSITGNTLVSEENSVRGIRSGNSDTTATGNNIKLTGTTTIGFSGTSGATYATVVGNNFRGATTPVSIVGVGAITANNQV